MSMSLLMDGLVYAYSSDALDNGDMMYHVISLINLTIPSIILLKHSVYDVLQGMHPIAVENILELEGSGFRDPLKHETLESLPYCPLTNFLKLPWDSIPLQQRRKGIAGMGKCLTFPVIDIQSSVDNVVTKA